MTIKNRLEKLDNQLTVKQYILRMVEEMQQYDSFNDYLMRHFSGKLDEIRNDFNKVADGISNKMKGEGKAKITRTVAKAHKEGMFLYFLLGQVIASYQNDYYRHVCNGLTLLHLFQSAQNKSLQQLTSKEVNAEELQKCLEEIREIFNTFRARAKQHLYCLLTERQVVEEISKQFFDRRELMFKEDRNSLAAMTKQAMEIINLVEDLAAELVFFHDRENFGEDGPAPMIDIKAIHAEVERDINEHVGYEVNMARAEVFSSTGKLDQGRAIYAHYGRLFASREKMLR